MAGARLWLSVGKVKKKLQDDQYFLEILDKSKKISLSTNSTHFSCKYENKIVFLQTENPYVQLSTYKLWARNMIIISFHPLHEKQKKHKKDFAEGRYTKCKTKEELEAFLEALWHTYSTSQMRLKFL